MAQWYRLGSVRTSERRFWFEYGQIIYLFFFFIFYDFFYCLLEMVWVVCFPLNALLLLIVYLVFILKQNTIYIYMNMQ